MTCENCQSRPATVFISQSYDGLQRELRLCHHCATAMQSGGRGRTGPFGSLESLIEQWMGPTPKRDSLLSHLSEMAQRVLAVAARRSLEWGHDRVLPEFLLLAILEEVPELRSWLESAGVPVDAYEEELERVVPKGEPREDAQVALSSAVKRILQLARYQAVQLGHDFIGPQHLLLATALEGESFAAQFLNRMDPEEARQRIAGAGARTAEPRTRAGERLPRTLAKFGRDLTALARAGELDPIIGRDQEIERVVRILSRKTKNNPVLIGEPGVGKTAIAEGLAQRIVSGQVPEVLEDKRVVALDLGAMVGGTRYRGEFEERMTQLLKEIRELKGKIILFIDEIHAIVGAGGAEGAVDASNMLKPSLARGELQCLGATTLDEYRKNIEKDAALERRFQPVMVSEPTPEQAIEILRGLRDSYEAHHRVKIADPAIVSAVELSHRYVADRFLPDKAIDLLDEACAMVRLAAREQPKRVKELEEALEAKEKEKQAAVSSEKYDQAARIKAECEQLRKELEALRRDWQQRSGTTEPTVTPDEIARVVSEWTGIPANRLRTEERQRLLEMEEALKQRVVGQADAIRAISEAVRRARAGLKDPNRPIGSFIFLGPTGVGKTETARALAEYLFNDEAAMIRFDMSEYMERHTVSRLIGAPPGYVGYEEAGKLTEAVRRRPYSVVLFDEIEKAHEDVFNLLLQVLDDGRLTDSKGRTVNFTNTVVIMTSNVGAQALASGGGAMGFRATEGERPGGVDQRIRDAVMSAMRERFRPEFINRIDEIIVFQPLGKAELMQVLDLVLEKTRRKLRGQNMQLEVTDAAREELARRGYDPTYGARPLRRVVQREVENEISRRLLAGDFNEGDLVRVDFVDGAFRFSSERGTAANANPPEAVH